LWWPSCSYSCKQPPWLQIQVWSLIWFFLCLYIRLFIVDQFTGHNRNHSCDSRDLTFVKYEWAYCHCIFLRWLLTLSCFFSISWNPSGAIKAGRNSAVYLYKGKTVEVAGKAWTYWL
jgi:hypothetical protein